MRMRMKGRWGRGRSDHSVLDVCRVIILNPILNDRSIGTVELESRAVAPVIAGRAVKECQAAVASLVDARHWGMRGSRADHSVLQINRVVVLVLVLHTGTVGAVERDSSTVPTIVTTGATDQSYRALLLYRLAMAVGDGRDEEGKRDSSDQTLHVISLSRIKQITSESGLQAQRKERQMKK
jgi:hypothetical protein